MVQIRWTKRSLQDLKDIYAFIAKDSPRYAQIQIEKVLDAAGNLSLFPYLGKKVQEFPHLDYREIIIERYRVFYRREGKRIFILSAVHSRRDLGLK